MQPKIQILLLSFFSRFKKATFVKGETIINPRKSEIFYLTKGTVRMFSLIQSIKLTLNIYRPFSILPMSQILGNNKQNKYIFDALTKVEGYFAPKKEFEGFIQNNPGVLLDLLKRIYLGLDGYYMVLESLLLGDAYLRVLTQLVIYTRRFGKKNQDKIIFDFHLTHHQLASQTGLARESVTKMIKKLQDKGLIGYSGKKLLIYDITKLERERFNYSQANLIENLPLDNS